MPSKPPRSSRPKRSTRKDTAAAAGEPSDPLFADVAAVDAEASSAAPSAAGDVTGPHEAPGGEAAAASDALAIDRGAGRSDAGADDSEAASRPTLPPAPSADEATTTVAPAVERPAVAPPAAVAPAPAPVESQPPPRPRPRAIVWCHASQVPLMRAVARRARLVIGAIGGPSGDLSVHLTEDIRAAAALSAAAATTAAPSTADGPATSAGERSTGAVPIVPADGPTPCTDLRQAVLNVAHDVVILGTFDDLQREEMAVFLADRGDRVAALEPAVDVSVGEALRAVPKSICFVPAFRDSAAFRVFHDARDRFGEIVSVSVFFAGRPEHGALAARAADAVDVIEALVGGVDLVDAGFAGPIGPAVDAARKLRGHVTFNLRGLSRATACGHATDSSGAWTREVRLIDGLGQVAVLTDDRVAWWDSAGRLVHHEVFGATADATAGGAKQDDLAGGAAAVALPPPIASLGGVQAGRSAPADDQPTDTGNGDNAANTAVSSDASMAAGERSASTAGGAPVPVSAVEAPSDPDAVAWSGAASAIAAALDALLSDNPAVIEPGLVDPLRTAAVVETLALSLRTGQGERPSKIEAMLRRR